MSRPCRPYRGGPDEPGESLAYANHLGFFAEEVDKRGLPLGNFPQALSHLAFISAAYFLDRRLDPTYRPSWEP